MKVAVIYSLVLVSSLVSVCRADLAAVEANPYATLVDEYYSDDEPGVSILVARKGEVLFHQAYGLANLDWKVPATPGTVYQIDSITKLLTATATLKLVEEGVIELDDLLSKFYPKIVPNANAISILHLLSHTSGVVNQSKLGEKWLPHVREEFTLEDILGMISDEPADFLPGERAEYNNNNYVLLGAVIEKVTGKTYAKYMEDEIFRPLGLKRTYYGSYEQIVPNRAEGYVNEVGRWKRAPFMSMTHPYAAGAILSTVEDLYIWASAVSERNFLSVEAFQRSLEPTITNSGEPGAYGLAWLISDFQKTKAYSHGGGSQGFSSAIILVPEFSTFVAVLSNNPLSKHGPTYVARRLAALAIGRPFEVQTKIMLPHASLRRFVGSYAFSSGQEVKIEANDNRLVFVVKGGAPVLLFAESQDTFFMTAVEAKIQFQLDNRGAIQRFVFIQGEREIPATRSQ